MNKRKIFLIIGNIVLLTVVICQFALKTGDKGKTFRLKETPDEIIIEKGNENVLLSWNGNSWVVGEKQYKTNMYGVNPLINSIENIRCLEKVSSITKQGAIDKYELTEDKKITVTARKDGKDLRTIDIGKTASTVSQNFITVDGGKDIYLATGGLRNIFGVNESNLRSDEVWNFDSSEISSVEISTLSEETSSENVFSVRKTGSGEDLQWSVVGSDIDLDSGKAQTWFDSLGNLTTTLWYDETEDLGGTKIASVKITHSGKVSSIDIFELPLEGEETIPSYYGKSSETPYPFQLTSYTMEKINKNPEELAK